MAVEVRREDATLNNPFGHKQELKKKFGFLSMLGLAFVILGTWTSTAASLNIALPSGGPIGILYGLVVAGISNLAVAASLAELCSVFPANGAQYEWISILAGERYHRYLSYVSGWVVTASWWALAAAGPSLFANLVIALIQLFDAGKCFWHAHLAMDDQGNLFVFTGFINHTGWNDGTAWLLGLLQACFTLSGFDAVAHLVEEMPNPRRDAPRTMVLCVMMGTVTGIIFVICTLFSIQDIDEVSYSKFGPLITIAKQVSGSAAGAVGIVMVILIVLWSSFVEVVTSASRMTAAFARQGGIPAGIFFAQVNKKLDAPLNSMLLTNAVVIVFGCIYLATETAFNAILSACTFGLGLSYLIPISLLLIRGREVLKDAQFSLGKCGYAINLYSAVWLVFTNVLFLFPSTPHVTGSNMNYAIVAIAVVVVFATVYWFVYGHKHYEAPLIQLAGWEPHGEDRRDEDRDEKITTEA